MCGSRQSGLALKFPEWTDTVAIWQRIERKALNFQTDTTQTPTDAQCDGTKCVLCGQWACPPLISFPWRIDIILGTAWLATEQNLDLMNRWMTCRLWGGRLCTI